MNSSAIPQPPTSKWVYLTRQPWWLGWEGVWCIDVFGDELTVLSRAQGLGFRWGTATQGKAPCHSGPAVQHYPHLHPSPADYAHTSAANNLLPSRCAASLTAPAWCTLATSDLMRWLQLLKRCGGRMHPAQKMYAGTIMLLRHWCTLVQKARTATQCLPATDHVDCTPTMLSYTLTHIHRNTHCNHDCITKEYTLPL